MSLYGAMYSGVSGLNAQSRSLGVISQNIANVNTTGYKASRTQFATMMTGTDWGRTYAHSTGGVQAYADQMVNRQGQLTESMSGTDLAITGDGFFAVSSQAANGQPAGETLFTRSGAFNVDQQKNLVNGSGLYLLGYRLNGSGEIVNANNRPITPDLNSTADMQVINLNGLSSTAQPTEDISVRANLPNALGGTGYSTSVQVYDAVGGAHKLLVDFTQTASRSLSGTIDPAGGAFTRTTSMAGPDGNTHDVTLTFTPTGDDSWTAAVSTADGTVTGGSFDLSFNADGTLASDPQQLANIEWADGSRTPLALDLAGLSNQAGGAGMTVATGRSTWQMTVGSADPGDVITGGGTRLVSFEDGVLVGADTHELTIDWNDATSSSSDATLNLQLGGASGALTNYGNEFVLGGLDQDGRAFGAYSGVSIDEGGVVTALFDNGTSRPVFRIPVAQFNNPDGLSAVTGNAFVATPESGGMRFATAAGADGSGKISAFRLESSTVDLANEFTSMITTQRAYSANATVITTADEMLEELNRLKR